MLLKLFGLFIMFFTPIHFAYAAHIPQNCPPLASLKSVHFNLALPDPLMGWLPYNISYYNTPEEWLFTFYVFYIKSKDAAIERANILLPYLSQVQGPIETEDGKSWTCVYTSAQQDLAVAYTPPETPKKFVGMARFKLNI